MDPQGFAILKPNANCEYAVGDPKRWTDPKVIHVAMELNERTKSALLLNGAEMGMFDYSDLEYYFRCDRSGDILLPPGLDMMEQMIYAGLAANRNGGYNKTVQKMVIMASFHKGEFNDNFIWQKGQDPDVVAQVNALKKVAKERMDKVAKHRAEQEEILRKAAKAKEEEYNKSNKS